jgi:hypothetical protein
MAENKKTLPKFDTVDEIVHFFDENDMGDYLEGMPVATFEVDLLPGRAFVALEPALNRKLSAIAKIRGISTETLLNLWIQEKVLEAQAAPVYQVAEK